MVAITNASHAIVAEYVYDAWGNILAIKNGNGTDISGDAAHIAKLNPIRYRGYFYDTETGFYYLQSRYYDPVVGRFINGDAYASTGTGFLGYNMYTYCLNNPINLIDYNGQYSEWVYNGIEYYYNGTAMDFHRADHGQPPIDYENAINADKIKLAATVYGEAAGYNDISNEVVANVIMNRVGTTTVGGTATRNTVQDVVSEPVQFSCYGNEMYDEAIKYYTTGIIENNYNRMVLKNTMDIIIPVYEDTKKDITNGCTFFYSPCSMNPPGSVPNWVNGKEEVVIYGVDSWYFRFYK